MKQKTENENNKGAHLHIYGRRESHNHNKVVFACFSVLIRLASGVRPACDIPPVDSLGSTTITCYFSEKYERSDFDVINLSRNEPVVSARWDLDQYMYFLSDGFSMGGTKATYQITFKIDQVNSNQTGRYACVPHGTSFENAEICTLSLKSGERQQSTNKTPQVENVCEKDAETSQTGYLSAVIACSILSCILVICLVLWIVRLTRRKKTKQQINGHLHDTVAAESFPLSGKECARSLQDSGIECG